MKKIDKRGAVHVAHAILLACLIVLGSVCYLPAFAKVPDYRETPVKYIFLFIGDGMGQPQRTAAEAYVASAKGIKPSDYKMSMSTLPAQGVTTTFANDRFITGSAAAATALACGVKTNIGYIGVDPAYTMVKSIAEMARDRKMKVGIVSSVSIDHATPAGFYAHQPSRKMYHEIAHDLVKSGFNYFGGGGFKDPTGKKSKKPLGDVVNLARENGYRIVTDRSEFLALKRDDGKIIACNRNLPDDEALPYDMDKTPRDITLAEFTKKGIELLDGDAGFFFMVEGGKIDWACHANDAVAAIEDTIAFDEAVKQALAFYEKHPEETLIVVTGDHECGGLTLGFAGTVYESYFDVLKGQRLSFQAFTDSIMEEYKKSKTGDASFEDMIPKIELYFGLTMKGDGPMALKDFEIAELREAFDKSMKNIKVNEGTQEYLLYGGYDPLTVKLTHILNQKAGLGWTSYSHTGVPVTTSAIGKGAELFNGYYDNTDVAKKIMFLMGLKVNVADAGRDAISMAVAK
ncbi:MAG: alkaline phosphatase [Deltaproteobacteria bacterium]|nr:alkaline phosphatase [Deltaproteobacteria bacterium]MBN2688220.1 alkaline phosphatase [Deltaproteobacteria bacterium]